MKREDQRNERDRIIGEVLLKRFCSDVSDIPLTELFKLFSDEEMSENAVFWSYRAFAKWLKSHPSIRIDIVPGQRTLCLRMDAFTAAFVESITGQPILAREFTPVGDTIFTNEQPSGVSHGFDR